MERVALFKGKGTKKRQGENVSIVQGRGRKNPTKWQNLSLLKLHPLILKVINFISYGKKFVEICKHLKTAFKNECRVLTELVTNNMSGSQSSFQICQYHKWLFILADFRPGSQCTWSVLNARGLPGWEFVFPWMAKSPLHPGVFIKSLKKKNNQK